MKVLHVIPGVASRYGGPSRVIYEMGQALRAKGIEVHVATTNADGRDVLPVPLGEFVDREGVPTIFFHRQISEAFKFSLPLSRWLDLRVEDYDLVHVHAVFSHSSLAAGGACRRQGVPYVVRPLGSLDPWSLRQKWFLKKLLWWVSVGRLLRGARAIHYTTEQERRLAEENLGLNNGVVVPIGISDEWFEDARRDHPLSENFPELKGKPYVLILSRLHPKKRVQPLMDVFLEATDREGDPWTLVVAGSGSDDYVESLLSHRRRRNAEDRIVFTGWVEGEAKSALLQHAELFVLPSHQENFGLSAVESLAYGVPVLISDRVNLAGAVREAGAGWVSPRSRGELTERLREALSDPGERRARGAAGRRLVEERYLWSTVAEDLVNAYDSFLEDDGR